MSKNKKNKIGYKNAEALRKIISAIKVQNTSLNLSSMKLDEVPSTVSKLTWLTALNVMENNISDIPEYVFDFIDLKRLFLFNNNIDYLSDSIGNLTKLSEVALSYNSITVLPETISNLINLKELDLGYNNLTILPESIGKLEQLRVLDLSGNQLESLPKSITKIPLTELYLHGNNKLGLPIELLGPTWLQVINEKKVPAKPAEILEYYFRTKDELRPLNEAKLILVGRGEVGKTSIVNRLVHRRFELGEKKTDGINITEWNLKLNDNEDVKLNIWDFGGQEIMHATHQFFLTHRSLYLLVLNGREGGEDADANYWLKLIESFGDGSPVIIVMNKIKDHPFDLNRRALQSKYPMIRDFIKTDCEKEIGLEELYQSILRETDRLEQLRDPFPLSWFNIKDRLSKTAKNYLSFEDYRKVCAELGETSKTAQEALATYLNALGIVLNYKDDPRLRDTHVLNPHCV